MTGRFRHISLLLLFAHLPALSATPATMNQELARNREVTEVALSPDGRTIASVITDSTMDGGHPHLWLLAKAASPRQITGSGDSPTGEETAPAWSADGRELFYLQKSDQGTALKRMDLSSGAIQSLALSRQGNAVSSTWVTAPLATSFVVKGFALAPTGAIAIWASEPVDNSQKIARKEDQHLYGQSDPIRLFIVEPGHGPREIPLPDNIRTVTWSKDASSLLIITEPESDDLGALNRVWLLQKDRAPREIGGMAENVQTISWLPDGRIVYVARCSENAPIVCRDLFVQALDGSKPRNLTQGIDGSLINGFDGSAKTGPVVLKSGEVLATIARGFDQRLVRVRPTDGVMTDVGSFPAVVKAVASNAGQTDFTLLSAENGGVVSVQLADARLSAYAPIPVPTLQSSEWKPLRGRQLHWNSDNLTIEGLLYLPDGATADKRVPLVVDVHGGPAGRFEDVDYPLVRLLLAKGWAVLHVNPRGSFGYGTKFLASLQDDLGGGDYRDIMRGIDAALAQEPVDPDRTALIGFSYGATVVTFALGRTTRFKALVAAAPVVDQISEYGTESSSWYDRWYFGQPWKRLDQVWRQSPLSGVGGAKTPLLLLHGESDPVNPMGQSLELYRALRQEGVPVQLVLFPRETHHELGKNFFGYPSVEPHHGTALRQYILDFLDGAFMPSNSKDSGPNN